MDHWDDDADSDAGALVAATTCIACCEAIHNWHGDNGRSFFAELSALSSDRGAATGFAGIARAAAAWLLRNVNQWHHSLFH